MKPARTLQRLQQPQSLIGYVRQFLTPTVWKQARGAVPKGRSAPRWDLQPLVVVMLAMTWATGPPWDTISPAIAPNARPPRIGPTASVRAMATTA